MTFSLKPTPIFISILWVCIHILACNFGYCQTNVPASSGFELSNDKNTSTGVYHLALSQANLESYRLRKNDRVLAFEDGTEFKLFSAEQLVALGTSIELENYPTISSLNPAVSLVFKASPEGQLAVRSEIKQNSKLARIGKGFPAHEIEIISKTDYDQMSEGKQEIIRSRPHQYRIE